MIELNPAVILSMWAGGLAVSGALVARWRVVGPGFVWLVTGVTGLVGGSAWLAGSGPTAPAGLAMLLAAAVVASRPGAVEWLLLGAGVLFLAAGTGDGGLVLTVSGALALGGVTTEMMLGHWFLIDPRLPRWSLHRLVVVGMTGVVADAAFIVADAGFGGDDVVLPAAFATLAAATAALLVFVWLALREPGYSGVMAATGLSYLATLTVIGAVVAGRAFLEEVEATAAAVSILAS